MVPDRAEERSIRDRVVEGHAFDVDRAHTLEGHEQRRRSGRPVELLGDDLAELGALLWRGAHQRYLGIVDVDVPLLELLRQGLPGTEVDHVERAQRDDLGDALLGGGI